MKLAIFADNERKSFLEPILEADAVSAMALEYEFYENYDSFIMKLPQSKCNSIIVAHRGAMGMQGVRAAKILLHKIPIIWFSDDNGFVEESYNVGCAYFSAETITEKLLLIALKKCETKGEF